MRIGSKGLSLIKSFEGYETRLPNGSCQAYLDTLVSPRLRSPGYKGLWTIGYGCTVGVTSGMVWSEYQATRALMREVYKHESALNANMKKYGVKLDQNQFDALVSASYNLGSASTLIFNVLTKLAAGDEAGAKAVFLKYNRAGGRVIPGLTRRRQAEADLFDMHTQGTLVAASSKLSWMKRIRAFIASLGLGTYFTWDNLTQVQDFIKDNPTQVAAYALLFSGGAFWLFSRWMEYKALQDNHAGRYTPSGDVE